MLSTFEVVYFVEQVFVDHVYQKLPWNYEICC